MLAHVRQPGLEALLSKFDETMDRMQERRMVVVMMQMLERHMEQKPVPLGKLANVISEVDWPAVRSVRTQS